MSNTVDLHIHTTASDGQCSPAQVLQMGHERGLCALAITDHDTVDGAVEAMRLAADSSLAVIAGVEVSTDWHGQQLHVLGYLIDPMDTDLAAMLADSRASRVERGKKILRKLHALGAGISFERVREIAGDGAIGRPHIAMALQEAAHVESVKQAFELYLGRGQAAYVPRAKLTPGRAMALILAAGGVPVLAHPWGVTSALDSLISQGLAGLEAYYAGYTPSTVDDLVALAKAKHLICTGGSDFHGLEIMPSNDLGCASVPAHCVDALYERRRLLQG